MVVINKVGRHILVIDKVVVIVEAIKILHKETKTLKCIEFQETMNQELREGWTVLVFRDVTMEPSMYFQPCPK